MDGRNSKYTLGVAGGTQPTWKENSLAAGCSHFVESWKIWLLTKIAVIICQNKKIFPTISYIIISFFNRRYTIHHSGAYITSNRHMKRLFLTLTYLVIIKWYKMCSQSQLQKQKENAWKHPRSVLFLKHPSKIIKFVKKPPANILTSSVDLSFQPGPARLTNKWMMSYCWWKKSSTCWYGRLSHCLRCVSYISGGCLGSQQSTVCLFLLLTLLLSCLAAAVAALKNIPLSNRRQSMSMLVLSKNGNISCHWFSPVETPGRHGAPPKCLWYQAGSKSGHEPQFQTSHVMINESTKVEQRWNMKPPNRLLKMTGIRSPVHPFCSSKLYLDPPASVQKSHAPVLLIKIISHLHKSLCRACFAILVFWRWRPGFFLKGWKDDPPIAHRSQWNGWCVEVLILDPNGCAIELFLKFFPASS